MHNFQNSKMSITASQVYSEATASLFTPSTNEQTSLISPRSLSVIKSDDQYVSMRKSWYRNVVEFRLLIRSSAPVIFAYTLQESLQAISVMIVGRLGPEALATASFSYMFAMSTAWLIGLGGSTALDTLASSTFTGSKNPHDLGVLLQRALLILTAFYIPVAILWGFSTPVFRLLGQEEFICVDSAKFLTALIPGGLGYVYFETMKKYLQAQEIMNPGTYVLLITLPISAFLNYFFVHTLNLGLIGAPIATGAAYWLSFVLLVLYARIFTDSRCWGGWSRACFSNMSTFVRLAFLGVIHIGTEWWAFEIVALSAGRLGVIPLAAQSVISTMDLVMNSIPLGIGVATTARVGNLLGARKALSAARAANTSAWLSMIMGGLVMTFLISVRCFYARIFSDDTSVIKLTAQVLPWVAFFQVVDGLNASCGGSLRGMGRQYIGAIVNFASCYMGALPLGIWLAFNGWGLSGLWFGQCIAMLLSGVIQWLILALTDWEMQVKKAFQRMDDPNILEENERLLSEVA